MQLLFWLSVFLKIQLIVAEPTLYSRPSKSDNWASEETEGDGLYESVEDVVDNDFCCERRSRHVRAGFDWARSQRYIDVGTCVSRCATVVTDADQLYLTPVNSSPESALSKLLWTIGARSEEVAQPDCSSREKLTNLCRPLRSQLAHVHLIGGEKQFQVIEQCVCEEVPQKCTRLPRTVVYHPNSPFQTEVDVGFCAGPCSNHGPAAACKPSENETVVINGPNGAQVINKIKNCHCKGECFRVPHRMVFFVYGPQNETVIREIDIGKCVGNCINGSDCVLRSKANKKRCLAHLESSRTCMPIDYKRHSLQTMPGHTDPVLEVTQCGCR